jgi:hypothetical protein
VGRAAGRLYLDPNESLVPEYQSSFAWFSHDASIGLVPGDEIVGAEAGVLLVGYERSQDTARQTFLRQGRHGSHYSGSASLHVVAAAAVNAISLHRWLKRRNRHSDCGNRIEMGAEDHSWAIASAGFRYGVRPAGCNFFEPTSDSPADEPIAREARDR